MLKVHEEKIINALCTGNAIIFTGAGFSFGAMNLNDRSPLMSRELSKKISQIINMEEDDDLGYTSDVLIEKHKDKIHSFIEFLKLEYTIKEVAEYHKTIASIKWKRIYTTNYDDVFESALKENNKQHTSVDISMKPKDYYKQENNCIHLNGFIGNLKESDLESKFKLSHSSYVSADDFTSSEWYSIFKKDIEHCSVLLFVGYSLYDIDIEKILFSHNDDIKEKTFFIIGENDDKKLNYKLSKYGVVIREKSDCLATLINKNIDKFNISHNYVFSGLKRYRIIDEIENEEHYIMDKDISEFLVYGKSDDFAIQKTVLEHDTFKKYAVYREDVEHIYEILDKKGSISFGISDFCNGKSVFCQQLAIFFLKKGYEVYTVTPFLEKIYEDLEFLNTIKQKKILIIIDDYPKVSNELQDFMKIRAENIKVFLTARTSEHLKESEKFSIDAHEINLDFLNNNEISSLVEIFDGLGAWGDRSNLKFNKKVLEIENRYDRQLALALNELLKSEVIKNKVEEILNKIFNVFSRRTIFFICIFRVMGEELDKSLLDELSKTQEIYNSKKIKDPNFCTLFSNKNGKIDGKSSLFCAWMIKNFFSAREIMQEMHLMAKYFNTRRKDFHNSYTREKIFRNTLKFSFIERILPEEDKRGNLKFYYDKLKDNIDWLKQDPHFWLQYSMAFMTFPDKYEEAQSFLNVAYSLAENRYDYNLDSLNNQQARLYIKFARKQSDGGICFDYFKKAHGLLAASSNNMYKFRQMQEYGIFYKEKFQILSVKDKNEFLSLIRMSIHALENEYVKDDRLKYQLIKILENIIEK